MTGSNERVSRTRWRHLRLLAAFALVVVMASPGAAAEPLVVISPDLVSFIQVAFGGDFTHTPTADESEDPDNDSVNYAGDSVPGEPGITVAGWHDVNGKLLPGALESICAEGAEPLGADSKAVCPDDRSALAAATNFVIVYAILSQGIDVRAKFSQFAFFWAEAGREVYDGAPGDPNNNETDSFDLFVAASLLSLGRTSYREGGFIFDGKYGGMLAFLGPRIVALLIPREEFFDSCVNVAVALILEGGVIDKASLPDNPTGTFARTAPPPSVTPPPPTPPPPTPPPPTTTTTTPSPPAVTPPPPDTPAPPTAGADPPASQATPDSGDDGGSTLPVAIGIGIAAIIISVLIYLYTRRRAAAPKPPPPAPASAPTPPTPAPTPPTPAATGGEEEDCEEERRAYAAARAASAAAAADVDVAGQAHLEADRNRNRAGSAAIESGRPRRTQYPGGADGDADFARDTTQWEADAAENARARDAAQTALEAAEAALAAAVAAQGEAINAEFDAMAALNACLGRPAPPPPTAPDGPDVGGAGAGGESPGGTRERGDGGSDGEDDPDGDDPDEDDPDGDDPRDTPPPPAPDAECSPEGDTELRSEMGLPVEVFDLPRGNVVVDVLPRSNRWVAFVNAHGQAGPGGGSFTLDTFTGFGSDEFANAVSDVSANRVTVDVFLPVNRVTLTCKRVWRCDGTRWVRTQETEVTRTSEEAFRRWRTVVGFEGVRGHLVNAAREIDDLPVPETLQAFDCE